MRVALLLIVMAACGPTPSVLDEDPACTHGEIRPCGDGVCAGEQLCEGGQWSACYGGAPATEICDGIDNNCDGVIDNGDNACGGVCDLGGVPGAACDGEDGDVCEEGTLGCASANLLMCSDTTGTRVELCGDGTDDNCDGRIDEYCAAQLLRWSDHGGSTAVGSRARALDVAVDADGSVYVVGTHSHTVTFGGTIAHAATRSDGFVLKYDTAGQLVWHRAIGGAGDAAATAVVIAPEGSILVGGSFGAGSAGAATFAAGIARSPVGGNDVFVARYSAAGAVLDVTAFGSDNDDELADLAVAPSGHIAITGHFLGSALAIGATTIPRPGFNASFFAARLDAALDPTWARRIELVAPATGEVTGDAIAFDPGGGVVVGGAVRCFTNCTTPMLVADRGGATETTIAVSASLRAGYLARFDADGALLVAVAAPRVHGIAIANETLFVTGAFSGIEPFAVGTPLQTTLVANGQADVWLGRYTLPTSGLEFAWAKRFGSSTSCGGFGVASDDAGLAIALDGDAPVVAGTHHQSIELASDLVLPGNGWGNVFWAGFDGAGTVVWGHNGKVGEQPCSGGGNANAIAVTPNGDVVVAGDFTPLLILPNATLAGAINTTTFFVTTFVK